MAKFKTDTASGLLKSDDISLQKIDIPEIKFNEQTIGYDYHKNVEAMLGEVQAQEQKETVELVISELDLDVASLAIDALDVGGSWQGIVTASEDEQLLSQAKKLIAQKEFKQALSKLNEVLQIESSHHEAIYLKAYCQVELNSAEEGLYTLAPLRQANLAIMLQSRVKTLKEKIRKRIINSLLTEMFAHKVMGLFQQSKSTTQSAHFIARLQTLIELDPGVGMYYFLLATKLMDVGQIKNALDVATTGLEATTTGDTQRLEQLRQHLEKLYLREILKPAVVLFKQKKYHETQIALKHIASPYRANPLVAVFNTYLQQFTSGGLISSSAQRQDISSPAGKPKDVEELYSLLVGEEINQASRLLRNGQFDKAEQILIQARSYTPAFAYVNYMLANCIYMHNRLLYLVAGVFMNKDSLIAKLEEARIYAMVGANGKAPRNDLTKALDSFIERLQEETQADSVIREFMSIMDSAHKGIRDISQFKDVQRRMIALKRELSTVKPGIKSSDILGTLNQLDEIVGKNLDQLKIMEREIKDAEFINELTEEFHNIMQSAGKGISSSSQLETVQSRFKALKRKIDATRNKVISIEGKNALDQLDNNVEKNLEQLREMEQGMKDAELVNGLTEEFHNIMQSAGKGISSSFQLETVQSRFKALKKKIEATRNKVISIEGKNALNQLDNNVKQHLRQLDSMQAGLREQEIIGPLISEFNTMMQAIQSNPISSRDQLYTTRRNFRDLKEKVEANKWKVNQRDSKKAIDDLITAINNVLSQLDAL